MLLETVCLMWLAVSVASQQVDPSSTLDCHRRVYNHKVSKADSQGRLCWDTISVMSCWGRCDSNEISDWRFPYKRSFHPVCLFDSREIAVAKLSNCDPDVEPGTELYQFQQALSCRCLVCKSSEASCEGLRESN
ncbi:thyrostimulin beta-5 subunit-like [Nilaparvata lugens]|uniref:Glycoprotein hormone beta 5 n=1 Tax=Nilaparvata lugens TaxID=108931 RepID=U3U437_NILLU|nr:thyrostimulin beta-5 subunit-like [Nilaparvata lugens]XP_039284788.1 thyrostimulin beta-5 subunit-like [Nilaparvata lugens]BAO00956.1 glycoprotein hormone beta 5 [Nilaparvata lugens]